MNTSFSLNSPSSIDGAKFYIVPMFPYPSGKLHMGHARNYAISDAYAREAKARGVRVLHPMGWDSFGLPAEKAAIEHGADPKAWTEANIDQMKIQLQSMDFDFDWECELKTHEPQYYGRTQRLFCELMKAGLVYRKTAEVWWDPVDRTVLANEQVVDGKGWRSGASVERRVQSMYWIETSKYAEELAREPLEWSKGAKADHLAWIGWDPAEGPRLRDWCVSRQRRWGTPVPAIECEACGSVPAPDSSLPRPHDSMGKPCACPSCGGPAKSSDETLDTFFDSAWYFLRYPEARSSSAMDPVPFGKESGRWTPVDLYVGGREHATMHLLYARFLSRALADAGWECPREPFRRYMSQGMVKSRAFSQVLEGGTPRWVDVSEVRSGPGGVGHVDREGLPVKDEGIVKMSKSKKNGVDPSQVMSKHGVDAMRLYLFFAAPFEFDIEWDEKAVAACVKFCERFRKMGFKFSGELTPEPFNAGAEQSQRVFDSSVQGHYARHEGLNGLVAAIMKRCNEIDPKHGAATEQGRNSFLHVCKALHPLAPSLAKSCALMIDSDWTPSWVGVDVEPRAAATASVALQVNGRFVEAVELEKVDSAAAAFALASKASEKFKAKCEQENVDIDSTIWVSGRVLNAVGKRGPKGR